MTVKVGAFTAVSDGQYLLREHDTPRSVAELVYGDGAKYQVLLAKNAFLWESGRRIEVPNKRGRISQFVAGESPMQLIARMFPNQPVHLFLPKFFLWNGGQEHELVEGDIVFIPER
jgi:hypothetical protein